MTAVGTAGDGSFVKLRNSLQEQYESVGPDGNVKVNKQFRRWEWFWEPRQMPDGSFPTAAHYLREARRQHDRIKAFESVQAGRVWKELGPVGRPAIGLSTSWNGIGRINTIDISRTNPDVMFAGAASGGLWKTTDAGANWSHVDMPGFPDFGISDIVIAPSNNQIIYVATGDVNAAIPGDLSGFPYFSYGVIKSTDGGNTWRQTGLTFVTENTTHVSRLYVLPNDPNTIIAATYGGMRRSTNGGETWQSSSTSATTFRDLVAHPTNPAILYASTFAPVGNAAIFSSADTGKTWQLMRSFPQANRIRLAVSPDSPDRVMAVASLGTVAGRDRQNGLEGVYRLDNINASWQKLTLSGNPNLLSTYGPTQLGGQGFYDLAMEISPEDANLVFVGGINIWRSGNTGTVWALSAHGYGFGNAPWVHPDIHFLKYHPTRRGVIYACNDGGISVSTNDGDTWRDISQGLRIQQYYSLSTTDLQVNLTLAGSQDNGTALTTNGSNFNHVLGGDGMDGAIDGENPNIVYGSQYYGQFYRSDQQGNGWRQISVASQRGELSGAWVSPIVTVENRPGHVYIGYSQVYRSTSYGSTWQRISNFDNPADFLRHIAVAKSDQNVIYAATSNSLRLTTNGGSTWSNVSGVGGFIQKIFVHPTNARRAWIAIGGFTSTKLYEFDNGTVTNVSGSGLPNVPCNSVIYVPGSPDRIFVGTDLGVYVREVTSQSWIPYGTNMPVCIISDMEVIPSTKKLRVSTYGRGIWEVDISQCTAATPIIATQTPTTVCAGDTVRLSVGGPFAKFAWSNGDTSRVLELVQPTQSGTYTVTVEDINGCRATSAPIQVQILRAPVRPTITRRGEDTLRATPVGGITQFTWFRNGQALPNSDRRDIHADNAGTYRVVVTNESGCTTQSEEFTFVPTTSVMDAIDASFVIAPNPVDRDMTVTLPLLGGRVIDVLSITGQTVLTMPIADGEADVRLDLGSAAPGTYLVRLRSGSSQWMKAIVKR